MKRSGWTATLISFSIYYQKNKECAFNISKKCSHRYSGFQRRTSMNILFCLYQYLLYLLERLMPAGCDQFVDSWT